MLLLETVQRTTPSRIHRNNGSVAAIIGRCRSASLLDHPGRTRLVKFVKLIWVRVARRAGKRVRLVVGERHRKPSNERWVVRRNNDGRTWAGPYRWQGITFTEAERFWHKFATIESAQAAIAGHGFVGVSVKQIV